MRQVFWQCRMSYRSEMFQDCIQWNLHNEVYKTSWDRVRENKMDIIDRIKSPNCHDF